MNCHWSRYSLIPDVAVFVRLLCLPKIIVTVFFVVTAESSSLVSGLAVIFSLLILFISGIYYTILLFWCRNSHHQGFSLPWCVPPPLPGSAAAFR